MNHTFILREVLCLRSLGWDVQTISIRDCDRAVEKLTADEATERGRTRYVKSAGWGSFLRIHASVFARRPLRYLRALAFALKLGHSNPAQVIRNAAYFAQAVVVGHWSSAKQISHVHAHFASTVALITSRVFDVPFSVTVHGPDEFTDPVGFSLAEKCREAAFVVAISDYARSQLMRFSSYRDWQKFEVCRLGISPAAFQPRASDAKPELIRIVCVARLSPVKGQHILIRALDRVLRAGVNARLHLVGDGMERPNLEAEVGRLGISEHVRFEGWLNQDAVQAVYGAADMFVLASFAEGVPVVLMEAMAMEIPCIATCVNGVPELIRDRQDGLLVPPSNVEALADAIIEMARDPVARKELGAAGRCRVLEFYDLDKNAAKLSGIFQKRL